MLWFDLMILRFKIITLSLLENGLKESCVKAVKTVKSFCFLIKQDCKRNLRISILYGVLVYLLSKQLFHVYCISSLGYFLYYQMNI